MIKPCTHTLSVELNRYRYPALTVFSSRRLSRYKLTTKYRVCRRTLFRGQTDALFRFGTITVFEDHRKQAKLKTSEARGTSFTIGAAQNTKEPDPVQIVFHIIDLIKCTIIRKSQERVCASVRRSGPVSSSRVKKQ